MIRSRAWIGGVEVVYLGEGRWRIGDALVDNPAVSATVRAALPAGGRFEVRAEGVRHGVIANNTFPATAWWHDVDPGHAGVAPDLDTAIWACLVGLRLSPETPPRARPPLVVPADASQWAPAIAQWLDADPTLADTFTAMAQLRALGHPFDCEDEDGDEYAVWMNRALVVELRVPAYEPPMVQVTPRARPE